MTKRPLLLLVPLLLGLAACGSDDDAPAASDTTEASDAPAASAEAITIKGFAFSPEDATFAAGDTVTVTNEDGAPHTITADDGTFDTESIDGGASAELTLDEAGSFSYHCAIHTYMKGTIEVTG